MLWVSAMSVPSELRIWSFFDVGTCWNLMYFSAFCLCSGHCWMLQIFAVCRRYRESPTAWPTSPEPKERVKRKSRHGAAQVSDISQVKHRLLVHKLRSCSWFCSTCFFCHPTDLAWYNSVPETLILATVCPSLVFSLPDHYNLQSAASLVSGETDWVNLCVWWSILPHTYLRQTYFYLAYLYQSYLPSFI